MDVYVLGHRTERNMEVTMDVFIYLVKHENTFGKSKLAKTLLKNSLCIIGCTL